MLEGTGYLSRSFASALDALEDITKGLDHSLLLSEDEIRESMHEPEHQAINVKTESGGWKPARSPLEYDPDLKDHHIEHNINDNATKPGKANKKVKGTDLSEHMKVSVTHKPPFKQLKEYPVNEAMRDANNKHQEEKLHKGVESMDNDITDYDANTAYVQYVIEEKLSSLYKGVVVPCLENITTPDFYFIDEMRKGFILAGVEDLDEVEELFKSALLDEYEVLSKNYEGFDLLAEAISEDFFKNDEPSSGIDKYRSKYEQPGFTPPPEKVIKVPEAGGRGRPAKPLTESEHADQRRNIKNALLNGPAPKNEKGEYDTKKMTEEGRIGHEDAKFKQHKKSKDDSYKKDQSSVIIEGKHYKYVKRKGRAGGTEGQTLQQIIARHESDKAKHAAKANTLPKATPEQEKFVADANERYAKAQERKAAQQAKFDSGSKKFF